MEKKSHKLDLELTEDLEFEQREWKVQRAAWFIMALLVTVGLLGLFGAGPLSSRTITSNDGALKLEYDRFERWQAPSTLRVSLRPTGLPTARLWISRDFQEAVKVESIVPPPRSVEERSDGMVYTFGAPAGEYLTIVFHLQTQKMGSRAIQLRANDGPALQAAHWVYP